MLGLSDLILDPVTSPDQALIRGALKDYFALQTAKEAGEGAFEGIFGGDSLARENQRLDIELKKRQLGMGPQDTQTFNDTPARRVLQALGITWGQELQPSSRSMGSGLGRFFQGGGGGSGVEAAKDSGFFKIGTAVGHEAMELGEHAGSGISSAIRRSALRAASGL